MYYMLQTCFKSSENLQKSQSVKISISSTLQFLNFMATNFFISWVVTNEILLQIYNLSIFSNKNAYVLRGSIYNLYLYT